MPNADGVTLEKRRLVQQKASSDLNLYVLMFYNLSFAFNCVILLFAILLL